MRTMTYGVLARPREVILEHTPQARGSAPIVLESCKASQDSFQADAAPVAGPSRPSSRLETNPYACRQVRTVATTYVLQGQGISRDWIVP